MPLVIVAFFTALIGVFSINSAQQAADFSVTSKTEVASVNVWAYFDALRQHRTVTPISSGSIADASITMPAGVTRNANWTNVVFDGRLWVYEQVPSGDRRLATSLAMNESRHGAYVGFKSGASLTTHSGYSSGITVPTGIPAGSLLLVTR